MATLDIDSPIVIRMGEVDVYLPFVYNLGKGEDARDFEFNAEQDLWSIDA